MVWSVEFNADPSTIDDSMVLAFSVDCLKSERRHEMGSEKNLFLKQTKHSKYSLLLRNRMSKNLGAPIPTEPLEDFRHPGPHQTFAS